MHDVERSRTAQAELRGDPLELTEREARAVVEVLDDVLLALHRRLPMTVELAGLDVQLRRRVGGEPQHDRAGGIHRQQAIRQGGCAA